MATPNYDQIGHDIWNWWGGGSGSPVTVGGTTFTPVTSGVNYSNGAGGTGSWAVPESALGSYEALGKWVYSDPSRYGVWQGLQTPQNTYDLQTGTPNVSYEQWRYGDGAAGSGASNSSANILSEFITPTSGGGSYTGGSYTGGSTTPTPASTPAPSAPPATFEEFKQQYNYQPPVDMSNMAATVAAQVQDTLDNLPTYDESRAAAAQQLGLAQQGLAELNANRFDPTAYREAERGKISRNAKDIAQQSLSAMANKGQVNSSIGSDFISGNVNKYIADAFTDLEGAILEAEQKDQANRTNMYNTIGSQFGQAATLYGNITKNMEADRINAINAYSNTMKDLTTISTAQNKDLRDWVTLYDNMLTSDVGRRTALENAQSNRISAGAAATSAGAAASRAATDARNTANLIATRNSADERAWRTLYDEFLTNSNNRAIAAGNFQAANVQTAINLAPGTQASYGGANFVLGGDNQFYDASGNASGVYASGNQIIDANGTVAGYITNDGRIVANNGLSSGTWSA